MRERALISTTGHRLRRVVWAALIIASVACVGCQPKDVRPGLWLDGETVSETVDDWSFTHDVEEIFVQTKPWWLIPHSTTIWCIEVGGELYIGSYGDSKKTWEKNVARDPDAKLRIDGKIYSVTLKLVTDDDQTAALDRAYNVKYDMEEVFGDDLPRWWFYHAEQRES